MFTEISTAKQQEEEKIQTDINLGIDLSESLVFQSGAGAGKTYALVESLKYIINKYGKSLSKHSQKILCISLCQDFLGTLFTPVFPALYSCTLFRLPRECLRLVPWHFKLGSKDQEPNLKCQDLLSKTFG